MSEPIVTLEEAKDWCRYTEDWEDATFVLLIAAASEAVIAVADKYDPTLPAPAIMKLAVLGHVAQAFDGRGDGVAAPEGNTRLLMPLRTLDV